MFSKRELEGVVQYDNRESPGFSEQQALQAGLPPRIMKGGMLAEVPVVNCSHCHRHIMMNPLRTRDRAYCPKCDRYICDQCEVTRVLTGVCKPWKQVVDEFVDAAAKGTP